jgi:hypothetical protein
LLALESSFDRMQNEPQLRRFQSASLAPFGGGFIEYPTNNVDKRTFDIPKLIVILLIWLLSGFAV